MGATKTKTQKDYIPYINEIVKRFGTFQVDEISPEAGEIFRDSMGGVVKGIPKKPYAGNNALAALKAMFKVAMSKTSIFGLEFNPMRDVEKFGKKEGIISRHEFWLDHQVNLFIKIANEHDPEIGKCLMSFLFTGQRPMDCLLMPLSKYDGIRIRVIQEKTGAELAIRIHDKIKPMFDAEVARSRRLARIGETFIRLDFQGADLYSHMSKRWIISKH